MQLGILFHSLSSKPSEGDATGGTSTYQEQMTWAVEGAFSSARFKTCWDELVARHAVLRTFFDLGRPAVGFIGAGRVPNETQTQDGSPR